MKLLHPVVREDLAFVRRRIWALAPVWLIAAAISWALPDDQFHHWVIWGNLGIIVVLLTPPATGPRRVTTIYMTSCMVYLLTHGARWGFFGW